MESKIITEMNLEKFRIELVQEEKSPITISKYMRDVSAFNEYIEGEEITKDRLIGYKQHLIKSGYAVGSINSMIVSVNCFLKHFGWDECTVRCLKHQEDVFCSEEKELKKSEYLKLLKAAKRDKRLYLLMQTICGTGIRVSELKYFTVEAVSTDSIRVRCKNKSRKVIVPDGLAKTLLDYARERNITSGPIFCTRSGKPLDRSNIWHMMKSLCEKTGVLKFN